MLLFVRISGVLLREQGLGLTFMVQLAVSGLGLLGLMGLMELVGLRGLRL